MPRSFNALPRRTSSCQKVLPPSMMTSPVCMSFDKASIVASVIGPAGNMTQAVRGLSSLPTKSSRSLAPAALGEHVEIAARLRRLDHPKARLLARHFQILGIIGRDLQKHAAVGAAL